MKHFYAGIGLVVPFLFSASLSVSSEKTVMNKSGISFRANKYQGGAEDYYPSHICQGALKAKVSLADIGISDEKLMIGVECVAGDFDRNRYLDFVFFKTPVSKSILDYSMAKIVFFEGAKVKTVSDLKNPPRNLLPEKKRGPCNESFKQDALVQYGNGDANRTAVFIANQGIWKENRCASESN